MRVRRNKVKAVVYMLFASFVCIASALGVVAMFFSGTFIPVYVAGRYVLVNQLIRYALYVGLGIIFFYSQKLLGYSYSYLDRKSMKRKIGR